jgi:hypothetical protein
MTRKFSGKYTLSTRKSYIALFVVHRKVNAAGFFRILHRGSANKFKRLFTSVGIGELCYGTFRRKVCEDLEFVGVTRERHVSSASRG